MKTIQIPLELAEELLMELRTAIEAENFQYGSKTDESDLPDSYHKLKKLVDERKHISIKHLNLTQDEASEHKLIEVSSYTVKNGKLVLIKKDI